jgi:hypothetical protein
VLDDLAVGEPVDDARHIVHSPQPVSALVIVERELTLGWLRCRFPFITH